MRNKSAKEPSTQKAVQPNARRAGIRLDYLSGNAAANAGLNIIAQNCQNNQNMVLTEEQLQIVVQHLRSVAPQGFVCPICGERHWSINNVVFESREFIGGGFFTNEPVSVIPFVTLNCARCHNTMFLNAVALGIVPRGEQNNGQNQRQEASSQNNPTEGLDR